MTSGITENGSAGRFTVSSEHTPKSKGETYKRLHYYVAKMGVTVSDQLQHTLVDLRRNAHTLPDAAMQKLALKGFSDDEFVFAVKEILCIWLHLESVEQGGESMPAWLLTFLRLAFGATDYMIPKPKAKDVVLSYENCGNISDLCFEASTRVATALGFGQSSATFAPAFAPILIQAAPLRQQILEKALTLPVDIILASTFT